MVMAQYEIRDFKVNALPLPTGVPNSRYYVPNGNGTDVDEYITDLNGNYRKVNPVGSGISLEEVNETLVGIINNSNATFTTSFNFEPSSTNVYINGIRQQKPTHYNTVGNTTIIFTDSPLIGDLLEINYIKI